MTVWAKKKGLWPEEGDGGAAVAEIGWLPPAPGFETPAGQAGARPGPDHPVPPAHADRAAPAGKPSIADERPGPVRTPVLGESRHAAPDAILAAWGEAGLRPRETLADLEPAAGIAARRDKMASLGAPPEALAAVDRLVAALASFAPDPAGALAAQIFNPPPSTVSLAANLS